MLQNVMRLCQNIIAPLIFIVRKQTFYKFEKCVKIEIKTSIY